MGAPNILRGSTFKGTCDLKQLIPAGSNNTFPYIIPSGAVIQVHLPEDTQANPPVTSVILSTANALPNPPFTGNEVTPYNDPVTGELTGISFICVPSKSLQMLVGQNLAVDIWVIKDPTTSPSPVNIDVFEAVKVISVSDPENA